MRLLLVAMTESIHTARWIAQIADQGWDIHVFPSLDHGYVHPALTGVTIHETLYHRHKALDPSVKITGMPMPNDRLMRRGKQLLSEVVPGHRSRLLKHVIDRIKPDLVNSLEIQAAGYLTLDARQRSQGAFPPWIVTNWGSDVYLFGRLSEHQERVRRVLTTCDYYSSECQRDIGLAEQYGFTGKALLASPIAGGVRLDEVRQLRRPGPTSERRVIMLKGYQTWAGRALVGLRALERAADALTGYEVVVFSPVPDVQVAAELFTQDTGIPVRVLPHGTSHDEILSWHGRARISIGLGISDGISTSLLEAIAMGSFPIQTYTACADEWVVDGESALLVPPNDPDVVEQAIRRALADDALVNAAADHNWRTTCERLEYGLLKQRMVRFYEEAYADSRARRARP